MVGVGQAQLHEFAALMLPYLALLAYPVNSYLNTPIEEESLRTRMERQHVPRSDRTADVPAWREIPLKRQDLRQWRPVSP